jgi:TPP-dependent pyruvate/acetoin dehydrogenase alpha subunit
MLDAETKKKIDKAVEKEIAEAIDFAEKSPVPKPRALMEYVYAD